MLFFILCNGVTLAQPEIKFIDKVQKFDKVDEGEQLEFRFDFINEGDEPLLISNIEVACPCTKFEYPKTPIAPGEKNAVLVRFDTSNKIGYQDRELVITSNSKKSPIKIRFKGVVNNK